MNPSKLLPVASFQETLHMGYCGPACLRMVCAYYGIHKTEYELALLCDIDENLGVDAQAIKYVAKSLGFEVEIQAYAMYEDISMYLRKGIPVIVDWFTRGRSDYPDSQTADGHYSVVVGLDKTHIYLQDPEIGKLRKILLYDFVRVWFDFKGDSIRSWDDMIIRQIIAIFKK